MMADWEGLAFELGTWKNTGTFILKGQCSSETHFSAQADVSKAAGISPARLG